MFESLMSGTMRRRRSMGVAPRVGWFVAGAAAGGAGALLFASYSERDLPKQIRSAAQNWRERALRTLDRTRAARRAPRPQDGGDRSDTLPSKVGEASAVLSGDLPGSVGGLSAGALSSTEQKPTR